MSSSLNLAFGCLVVCLFVWIRANTKRKPKKPNQKKIQKKDTTRENCSGNELVERIARNDYEKQLN